MRVGVLGATGRIGGLLVERLVERGVSVVALYRDEQRAAKLPAKCEPRRVDLADPKSLRAALRDADAAVSVVPPALIPGLRGPAPANAGTGGHPGIRPPVHPVSRRAGGSRTAGRGSLARSGHKGVVLNPTMIYGPRGENNVQRHRRDRPSIWHRATSARRQQPHPADLRPDVVACLEAGLFNPAADGPPTGDRGSDGGDLGGVRSRDCRRDGPAGACRADPVRHPARRGLADPQSSPGSQGSVTPRSVDCLRTGTSPSSRCFSASASSRPPWPSGWPRPSPCRRHRCRRRCGTWSVTMRDRP